MVRPSIRRGVRVLLAVLAAAATGCASGPAPALGDLSSVDELKSRFNTDTDKVRVVLLLSPT